MTAERLSKQFKQDVIRRLLVSILIFILSSAMIHVYVKGGVIMPIVAMLMLFIGLSLALLLSVEARREQLYSILFMNQESVLAQDVYLEVIGSTGKWFHGLFLSSDFYHAAGLAMLLNNMKPAAIYAQLQAMFPVKDITNSRFKILFQTHAALVTQNRDYLDKVVLLEKPNGLNQQILDYYYAVKARFDGESDVMVTHIEAVVALDVYPLLVRLAKDLKAEF